MTFVRPVATAVLCIAFGLGHVACATDAPDDSHASLAAHLEEEGCIDLFQLSFEELDELMVACPIEGELVGPEYALDELMARYEVEDLVPGDHLAYVESTQFDCNGNPEACDEDLTAGEVSASEEGGCVYGEFKGCDLHHNSDGSAFCIAKFQDKVHSHGRCGRKHRQYTDCAAQKQGGEWTCNEIAKRSVRCRAK